MTGMLAFSNLLHYRLIDADQQRLRLVDFLVDLSTGSGAQVTPVTGVLFHQHGPGRPLKTVPWEGIASVDHQARTIHLKARLVNQPKQVEQPRQGELPKQEENEAPAGTEWLSQAVLIKRDLLDALMVDLQLRMPVTANDIWLAERKGQFQVTAVDIGFLAILRRMSGGRVKAFRKADLRDWAAIEFLRGDPAAVQAGLGYQKVIQRLSAGEIAMLIDDLPYHYAAELLTLLPEPQAADTLEMMMPELQLQALEELDQAKARHLLALMRPDILADLFSRLTPEQARRFLEHIPRRQAEQVLELLRYPEDTAGGLMTNDVFIFAGETRVGQALQSITETLKSPAYNNLIQFIYVVDQLTARRLRGALTLRDLLISDPDARLDVIMNPYLHPIPVVTPSMAAARQVIESGLTALPIVAADGRLLGAVTIDSALGVVKPKIGGRETLRLFT